MLGVKKYCLTNGHNCVIINYINYENGVIYMRKEFKEKDKEERLLKTAFELFTEKGIKGTSIQEIVDRANVAKGTFYLYFKDKYEIRDVLIAKKSEQLFQNALKELRKNYISSLSDQVIYIINYVINELEKMPTLLRFISKNLSWGIYNKAILKIYEKSEKKEESIY